MGFTGVSSISAVTYTNGGASTQSAWTLDELCAWAKKQEAEAVRIDEEMRDAVRRVIAQGPHALPFLSKHTGLPEVVLQAVANGEGRLPWDVWQALERLNRFRA